MNKFNIYLENFNKNSADNETTIIKLEYSTIKNICSTKKN